MSAESVRILWEFKKLAKAIRSKESEDGVKDTELELVYEACATSIERVIDEISQMFK